MTAIDATASGELERNLHRTASALSSARTALADAELDDIIARLGVVADSALSAGLGDDADVEYRHGVFTLTGTVRSDGVTRVGRLPHVLRVGFALPQLVYEIPGLSMSGTGCTLDLRAIRDAALRQARGQRP